MSTPDLEARVKELEGQLAEAEKAPAPAPAPSEPEPEPVVPLLTQVKEAAAATASGNSPHAFIERIRQVGSSLVSDGKIIETDILSPTEASVGLSTIIKLLAEVVDKV